MTETRVTDRPAAATAPTRAGAAPAIRWTGIVTAALLALIHLVEAPEYFEEQAYVGVLFVIGGVVLAAVAVALWRYRGTALAWPVGALVALGMLAGGIASRTTGLPGFHESEWEPLLLLSFVLEVAYLAVYPRAVGRRRAR